MFPRILIVDDEKNIRNILTKLLRDEQYTVQAAASAEQAMGLLDSFKPDLILMDQKMPGINGIEATSLIKEKHPEMTVIILTAHASIELAVEAIKQGAYDYLSKPFDNEELLIIIRRALERKLLTAEISQLKKELQEKYSFKNIIGFSSKMQQVFDQINRVCDTNATVLIQGESGTGKELVAKAIHYHSQRKDRPFVAINCGAIPLNLFESELFGFEKGSFTDARETKNGRIEQAESGTLFLDEIGELSLDAQVKLLRVLDERKITRIGGRRLIPVDVRFIASTNKNLQEEVNRGKFRLDLFYRLNVFIITIPPLRERREDIPLITEHFIQKHNTQLGLDIRGVSKSAVKCLQDHAWPGNVRDLENAIQSAMIQAQDDLINLDNLPLRICGYPEMFDELHPEEKGIENYLKEMNNKIEKEIIERTLKKCNGSRTKTAEILKITRKTLFNKMKRYGLL
jgi:DNA-binding NtrC family response regulator